MSLTGVVVNNWGQKIELTVVDIDTNAAVDISSYTTLQIVFKDPAGSQTAKTAAFVTSGTDGKLDYTIEQDLLDVDGTWQVRARVSTAQALLQTEWVDMHVQP